MARPDDNGYFVDSTTELCLSVNHGKTLPRVHVIDASAFKGSARIKNRHYDTFILCNTTPHSWQPPGNYYPHVDPYDVRYGGWKWDKRSDTRWLMEDRFAIDEFGTLWYSPGDGARSEPVWGALEEGWHLLKQYRLPDMNNTERYSTAKNLMKFMSGDQYNIAVELTMHGIGEKWKELRGFVNAMTDLTEYPDEVHKLLLALTGSMIDSVNNFYMVGAHAYTICDDWGTQTGALITPENFQEFFLPCYRRIVDHCHNLEMHCGIHSCGNIRSIIPLMIEAGFDFLQLDSPEMTGLDWLGEHAASKICFFNSVDL